jgi:hypothetical protein
MSHAHAIHAELVGKAPRRLAQDDRYANATDKEQ